MVDKTRLAVVLNKMTQSPLFHLFSASKELFHSNFLYWLSLKNQAEFLRLVCPTFSFTGNLRIEREWNASLNGINAKLDFYVQNSSGDIAVIENKVKDYADSEQVERIRSSIPHPERSVFVLLTLFHGPELSFPNWEVLDYRELSNRIVPSNFSKDPYHVFLIADYKYFTLMLAEFSETLGVSDDYDFAIQHDKELFQMLDAHKLWEAYQKMRSSHLTVTYNKAYNPGDVRTSFGVNHQKATINFFMAFGNDAEVGIQIEDDHYRKYVHSKNAAASAEALVSEGIFFAKSFRSIRNKDAFLKYKDTFKYQYTKMEGAIGFKPLFNSINSDLEEVRKNRERVSRIVQETN